MISNTIDYIIKHFYYVVFSLILLLILPDSQAKAATEEEAQRIGDTVIITGNKRTKESYIRKLIRKCVKDFDASPATIEQCLEKRGLFNDIKVQQTTEGQLELSLIDRIPFILIPILRSGGDSRQDSAGFFVLHSNIGGSGNILVGSLQNQVNTGKNSLFFLFGIQELGYWSNYQLFLRVAQTVTLNNQYYREKLIYLEEEETTGLGITFSHKVGAAILSHSLDISKSKFGNNEIVNPKNEKDRDQRGIVEELVEFDKFSLKFGYKIDKTKQSGYYRSGFSWEQSISGDFHTYTDNIIRNTDNNMDTKLETKLYYGVPSVGQQVLQINLKHEAREQDNAYGSYKIGGVVGSRALPRGGLWGNNYAYAAFDYQIPLIQRRYFTWTFAPFYDAGYINGVPLQATRPQEHEVPETRYLRWNSVGVGTYFYFARLTIPAIGFTLGTSDLLSENEIMAGLSLGARF